MSLPTAFILYAAIFRLALLAIGGLSIVLGYKLLGRRSRGGASAGSSIIEVRTLGLTMRNAAPGTIFCVMGWVVVGAVFTQGRPEIILQSLRQTSATDTTLSQSLTMRGGTSALEAATLDAMEFERDNKVSEAISSYERALDAFAKPANNLAWLYLKVGRISDSLPLSTVAIQIRPTNTTYLDTYARALCLSERRDEAIRVLDRIAQIDPSRRSRVEEAKRACK